MLALGDCGFSNLDWVLGARIGVNRHAYSFAEDLKLPDVAELAGMTESTFSRFFQKNTGNSFSDHLAKLRLWQACKLLADTDVAITDICFQVGYMNISNFNRAFLRKHKMTPSSYRKLSRQRLTMRA